MPTATAAATTHLTRARRHTPPHATLCQLQSLAVGGWRLAVGGWRLAVLAGTFARRARHPNECSGHLSQCFTPKHHSLLQPRNPAHCMTVGDQIHPHFFAQQMGQSHAPYPCRPHHGHPPQNQRIPLLCVTDHSSGHTEEWESLSPTQGATPKRGKTLPGAPGALTHSP